MSFQHLPSARDSFPNSFDYNLGITPVNNSALFFFSSTVFKIPENGWYRISVVGGGGTAACAVVDPFDTKIGVTGGGGGGFTEKTIYLYKNEKLTIIVGAQASANSVSGILSSSAGSNGNFSRVYNGKINLIATGGRGGEVGSNGGAGGMGYGGDLNFKGGNGGKTTVTDTNISSSGGAAGSVYGNGGSAGDATTSSRPGGGGVGRTSTTSGWGAGRGGGSTGESIFGISAGASVDGILKTGIQLDSFFDPLAALTGSAGGRTTAGGPGAGGGSESGGTTSGAGGFGGGGGCCRNTSNAAGGNGGIGGGGGGAAVTSAAGPTATAGRGGQGVIVIERVA